MTPPAYLPENVAQVWAELVESMDPAKRKKAIGPEFEAYCGCVANLRDVQSRLNEEGLIVPDSKNQAIPHPALAIQKQLVAELKTWGRKFQ